MKNFSMRTLQITIDWFSCTNKILTLRKEKYRETFVKNNTEMYLFDSVSPKNLCLGQLIIQGK